MAYLAVRGSGAVNGVSRLHGEGEPAHLSSRCSRAGRQTRSRSGHVTNGVHMPSWDSAAADELWTQACGKDRWLGPVEPLEQSAFVRLRCRALAMSCDRAQVSGRIRSRTVVQATDGLRRVRRRGAKARGIIRPDALTLGFARRFATYKRPNLLLHDPERLGTPADQCRSGRFS